MGRTDLTRTQASAAPATPRIRTYAPTPHDQERLPPAARSVATTWVSLSARHPPHLPSATQAAAAGGSKSTKSSKGGDSYSSGGSSYGHGSESYTTGSTVQTVTVPVTRTVRVVLTATCQAGAGSWLGLPSLLRTRVRCRRGLAAPGLVHAPGLPCLLRSPPAKLAPRAFQMSHSPLALPVPPPPLWPPPLQVQVPVTTTEQVQVPVKTSKVVEVAGT